MMSAPIFDIQRSSFVDGPGIRTTVFFKGCNLRCAWCHNPESQRAEPELMFYKDKCTGCGACKRVCPNKLEKCTLCGRCADVCPSDARKLCGRSAEVGELMDEIRKDKQFYASSGGGATFSGGECMLYPDFVAELCENCRAEGIDTAIDTAGSVPWRSFEKVKDKAGMFLYDLKCASDAKHREFTGVGNGLIIENLKKLSKSGARIWVRIPQIPEFNDSDDEFEAMHAILDPLNIEKVEILPYHAMGEHKYAALGREVRRFSAKVKSRTWGSF